MKKTVKRAVKRASADEVGFRKAMLARFLEEAWLRLDSAEEIARGLNLAVSFNQDINRRYQRLKKRFSDAIPERARTRAEAYFVVDSAIYRKDMLSDDKEDYLPGAFLPRRFTRSVISLGKQALAIRAKHFPPFS